MQTLFVPPTLSGCLPKLSIGCIRYVPTFCILQNPVKLAISFSSDYRYFVLFPKRPPLGQWPGRRWRSFTSAASNCGATSSNPRLWQGATEEHAAKQFRDSLQSNLGLINTSLPYS